MYKANKSDRLSSQLAHILPVAVVQFVDVFTDTGIVVTLYLERGIESIEFWAAVSFMALSIIITYCYALSISPSRGIRRALMLLFAVPLNLHMLIFGIEVVDEQREELKRETAGALLEKKQHLGEMKVIETCLESTALAIITTTMIYQARSNESTGLFWSSLVLSILSMAYGFYLSLAYGHGDKENRKVAGRRIQAFFCVLVHLVYSLAAIGSFLGTRGDVVLCENEDAAAARQVWWRDFVNETRYDEGHIDRFDDFVNPGGKGFGFFDSAGEYRTCWTFRFDTDLSATLHDKYSADRCTDYLGDSRCVGFTLENVTATLADLRANGTHSTVQFVPAIGEGRALPWLFPLILCILVHVQFVIPKLCNKALWSFLLKKIGQMFGGIAAVLEKTVKDLKPAFKGINEGTAKRLDGAGKSWGKSIEGLKESSAKWQKGTDDCVKGIDCKGGKDDKCGLCKLPFIIAIIAIWIALKMGYRRSWDFRSDGSARSVSKDVLENYSGPSSATTRSSSARCPAASNSAVARTPPTRTSYVAALSASRCRRHR